MSLFDYRNLENKKIYHMYNVKSAGTEMSRELPTGKVDMDCVNNWCINYGFKHKPID